MALVFVAKLKRLELGICWLIIGVQADLKCMIKSSLMIRDLYAPNCDTSQFIINESFQPGYISQQLITHHNPCMHCLVHFEFLLGLITRIF